jgi:hypothetical protein
MMNISSPAAYGFMPRTGAHARASSAPTPIPTPEFQQRSGGGKKNNLPVLLFAILSLKTFNLSGRIPHPVQGAHIFHGGLPSVQLDCPSKTNTNPNKLCRPWRTKGGSR